MYGALYVVGDLEQYLGDDEKLVAVAIRAPHKHPRKSAAGSASYGKDKEKSGRGRPGYTKIRLHKNQATQANPAEGDWATWGQAIAGM